MPADSGDFSYHVEALSLGDVGTCVYETVANLEHGGQPATRDHVAAAAGLSREAAGEALDELVQRGALVRTEAGEEHIYRLAERGWSNAPGQARGK